MHTWQHCIKHSGGLKQKIRLRQCTHLNKHVPPIHILARRHELRHEVIVGLAAGAGLLQALVARVLEEGGGVGAHVDMHRETLFGGIDIIGCS